MTMEIYKLTYADGTENYVQIDDSEDVGKAIKGSYEEAAKSPDNLLEKIGKGSPTPDNAGAAPKGGG